MTGYPFLDACMRSLNATKWLNFRARAMLVSFASYALNLDWRGFAPHLARTFLDYEPGIHYSQLQMQSGTTFGSTPRIYNPIKQSLEKDPQGEFIRRWVPELRDLGEREIHYPGLTSRHGYPPAIIDPTNLWSTMRANGPKSSLPRKTSTPRQKKFIAKNHRENQLELFLAD
jgi:deoxyribodipyrimidine photo-lyase